jgi:hypothetical protein
MSKKKNTPDYAIRILNDGYHEFPVIAIVCINNSTVEIIRAIQSWSTLLNDLEAMEQIVSDQVFEHRDPWFSFGILVDEKVIDEETLFKSLVSKPEQLVKAVEEFILTLIQYNKKELDGEGLCIHEECETGSFAILWLVLHDISFLKLYINFLESIDLDHTVFQTVVLRILAKKYKPEEMLALKQFVKTNNIQLLMDWTENDRAWQYPL